RSSPTVWILRSLTGWLQQEKVHDVRGSLMSASSFTSRQSVSTVEILRREVTNHGWTSSAVTTESSTFTCSNLWQLWLKSKRIGHILCSWPNRFSTKILFAKTFIV